MQMTRSFRRWCEKQGIAVTHEDDTYYEFRAPDGFVFPNDSRTRVIDIGDPDLTEAHTVLSLDLTRG